MHVIKSSVWENMIQSSAVFQQGLSPTPSLQFDIKFNQKTITDRENTNVCYM